MTWTPEPQGPCPCKTCAGARCLAATGICEPGDECDTCRPAPYTPIPRQTPTCVCCAPPEVTARWIEQTDPAPAEEPPKPGAFRRILNATRRTT